MSEDTPDQHLPDAFTADDPADDSGTGQFGAGHLVESSVPDQTRNARREASEDTADGETKVDESSEESFPGSDPPTYGGTPTS